MGRASRRADRAALAAPEELARSEAVVYAKWFRGRATFFSRPVFRAILAKVAAVTEGDFRRGLSPRAAELLDLLEDNSPQSTKELRAAADLQGRANEGAYTRALRELWARLAIVGVGEVPDGAFPSLAMSATRLRFEDLWPGEAGADEDVRDVQNAGADAARLEAALAKAPLFARELGKTVSSLGASNDPVERLPKRPSPGR